MSTGPEYHSVAYPHWSISFCFACLPRVHLIAISISSRSLFDQFYFRIHLPLCYLFYFIPKMSDNLPPSEVRERLSASTLRRTEAAWDGAAQLSLMDTACSKHIFNKDCEDLIATYPLGKVSPFLAFPNLDGVH